MLARVELVVLTRGVHQRLFGEHALVVGVGQGLLTFLGLQAFEVGGGAAVDALDLGSRCWRNNFDLGHFN